MIKTLRPRGAAAFTIALALAVSGCSLASEPAALAQVAPEQAAEWSISEWPATPLAAGRSRFVFTDWAGPAIPVYAYVPHGIDPRTAPVLIVMHGALRAPRRYLDEWVDEAERYGFIAIAPEFSRADFASSREYNMGNVTDRDSGAVLPVTDWSFAAIEPLFDHVVQQIGGAQQTYVFYGHSAGSQFVHRFLFLMPEARVSRYLPANAGWYSFADLDVAYPFGLGGLGLAEDDLRAALAKDVVILLGDQDADPDHETLNRSDEAMRQGPHRFARGQRFYMDARELAARNGWEFNWTLRTVEGVAHQNGGIARSAADLVR